jgi:hypothetical protein
MTVITDKTVDVHLEHAMKDGAEHTTADASVFETGNSHHKSKHERRLVLKQDLVIVSLLSGCFFFAYLVS